MKLSKDKQQLIDAIANQLQDLSVNGLQMVLIKIWFLKKEGL